MQIQWTCYDKQQCNTITELAMVSTTEGFTDNSTMSPGQYMIVKNTSARKSLRQFSEVLNIWDKTAIHRLGPAK